MNRITIKKLKPNQLKWKYNPKNLKFKSTKDVQHLDRIVGQPRAIGAIQMGAELRDSRGYNVFVTGLSGTGRMTTVKQMLEKTQKEGTCPQLYDYCYVNNFQNEQEPLLLKLGKGMGCVLADEMEEIINFVIENLPKIFEEDSYLEERQDLIEKYQGNEKDRLEKFDKKLKKKGFVRGQVEVQKGQPEPDIFVVVEEKAYKIESLEALYNEKKITQEQADKFVEDYNKLHQELIEIAHESVKNNLEFRSIINDYDKNSAKEFLDNTFSELEKKYKKYESIISYFEDGKEFLLDKLKYFRPNSSQANNPLAKLAQKQNVDIESRIQDIFSVNVILDNCETECAPVIIEHNPTYANLFGSFERVLDTKGYWRTDFSKIKAGSILKADQGFLIVSANDLFSEAVSWKAIKNVLLYDELNIQTYSSYLQMSESQLKPETIKVNVKVIIIGGQSLYNYLYRYEKGFKKIFKVLAQFDYETERNDEMLDSVVRFIAKECDAEGLLHFKPNAVAKVLEWAVEHAGSQKRITLKFSDIADLIRESAYYASKKNKRLVDVKNVEEAIAQRKFRNNIIDQKIMNRILDGSTLIDTEGTRVGQINGLTVMSTGIVSFGKPARITAAIGAGNRGIINIEREAQLSGSIHNKGVLIIQGFFLERFAQHSPLSLTASIAFEQSYGGIDGDSASAAEIYVLISAITNTPINQSIAITGSMNQKGDIQPIGGVNEKITGFYEICRERGFNGEQGVIIPKQNVDDLMLSDEIINSVKKGDFTIYSISKIEDGAKILMNKDFGFPDKDGNYKKNTLMCGVKNKLEELSKNSKPKQPTNDK